MKRVDDLISGIKVLSVTGDTGISVASVTSDSRKAGEGVVFIAVRGTRTDGHLFIEAAVAAGSTVIVCEEFPDDCQLPAVIIKVEDSAAALGYMASALYDFPSASLRLVGVTGTNGKTTIATLLYRMFMTLGYKCGLISTVSNFVHQRESNSTHTTPDPVALNFLLAEMVEAGCEFVFMEVSSHAVEQKRIAGLKFSGGVFTNLTHDHLDYHKTFDNYLSAKKRFFDSLEPDAFALVNVDDRNGSVMVQNCKATVHTYSLRKIASFRCSVIELRLDGMGLRLDGREVWTTLIGEFNAYNLLAVHATAMLLGASPDESLTVLSKLEPVAGRLEVIRSGKGVTGLVDYAHTPDALRNVTDTINRLRQGAVKLITVVGAG